MNDNKMQKGAVQNLFWFGAKFFDTFFEAFLTRAFKTMAFQMNYCDIAHATKVSKTAGKT